MSSGPGPRADTEPDVGDIPPPGRDRRVATEPGAEFDVLGVRSPLVGRTAQISRMREAVGRAMDFQAPQLITVVGNQGTGKTRLVSDLILQHIDPPTRVFTGRVEQPDGPRYAAITSLLRDRFKLGDASDPATIERFTRQVRDAFGDERVGEMVHFLGGFLDLPLPDSPFLRVLEENPQQHDEIAHTVLRRFIEVDAQKSPLVLVLDGLQWADDDTLRLLSGLGASLGGSPVVMICCARPEMLVRCGTWGTGATDHLRIDLRNLEPADAESMFGNLLSRCDSVPDEIIDDGVAMTGGNPYFLEQLVRLFLANGTIDTRGPRWRIDRARAAATELPISIEEAIEARIAALEPDERTVLEKGAVFGNVFWLGAVVAMTRIERTLEEVERPVDAPPPPPPPADLDYRWTADSEPIKRSIAEVVAELEEADYVLRLDTEDSSIAGDVELVFKHNLERELVENSTEPGRRARYHRLAAQWLETKLMGRSEEQLEFLAQLYERGGDSRRAARCYLLGGDKARERYANEDAVELYRRGLELIEDNDARARLDALHNLGDVLELTGDSDEGLVRFSEMLRLAWLLDNQAKAGAAHSRLGRIYRRRGEYDRAMEHLREANDLFTAAADRRGIAATLDDIGQVHWLRGAYGQALEFHRQALSIRRALGDRRSIALSLANIGRVHHDSGGFKAAIQQFREALDLRRDISDMSGVVASLCDLGGVHSEDGHYDMALELFSEASKIANDIGDKMAQSRVLSRMGECKSAMGRADEAIHHLEEAVDLSTQLGDRVGLSECCRRVAEVHLAAGHVQDARDNAKRALLISESIGSRVHVGTAHRVLAEVEAFGELDEGARAQAEEHFGHAVQILAGMKNELELARCYRGFAVFRERCGLLEDAAKLRQRADEIFGRLRGAASYRLGTDYPRG